MTPAVGYTEMRDSGIEWVGKIPKEWKVTRMKTILQNVSEKNHPDATVLSLYRDLGVVPKNSRDDNHNITSEDTSNYKFVRCGDLVINKMKAWQGSLAVSEFEGIVSPAYYVCKFISNSTDKKYLHYLLRCRPYAQEFERLSTGMRVGQWDLGIDDFLRIPVICPSISEQSAIAAYLDSQCAKIDEIIAEAKASIEDYKQWKASIIYEAVTKGLDPKAEMKDSGISSFGKIPALWEIYRFQILCKLRSEDNSGGRELLSVYLDRGVIKYSDSSGMQVHKPSDSLEKYQNVYVNDFVMNNQQAWRGSVGVSKYNGIVSPAYHVYELSEDCFPQYMSYLLRDSSMVQQYELASRGVGTIQRNIYEPWLRKSYIALPTLAEQAVIAAYLDAKCAKIDMLVKEKQGFIIDLESYKKSLIYEVVTGKRRVC